MLRKIVFLFIFILAGNLLAQELNDKKLQILAKKVERKGNIIIATGDVLIHSPTYYITSNKVIFDRDNSTLELFDNVNIIKDSKTITFSEYAFLDFKNEINNFTPVLFLDNATDIWINSTTATKEKDLMIFKDATLSSCDCHDPAWSISFSSADYNSTTKWMNIYNGYLYIDEVPAWYFLPVIWYTNSLIVPAKLFYTYAVTLPYFGFSTDDSRQSGLLVPTIGFSQLEGLQYAQPIYYAPKDNYDIEYIPQIRVNRGHGHQLQYRLRNTATSSLDIDTSVFYEEKKEYYDELNLENKKHYGYDLKYEHNNIFSSKGSQDSLLISLHNFNDIEYVDTKVNGDITNSKEYRSNILDENEWITTSQIKYFHNTNNFYGDIDLKYYKSTISQKDNNLSQELPRIHLHKYSSNLLLDNLLYSVDTVYSNKPRKNGLNVAQTDVTIPLTYSTKLFNDYLNISYSEQFHLTNIQYNNDNNMYKDGKFLENKHIVGLSVELLKPYTDYLHNIKFDITLSSPNVLKEDGDLYKLNNDDANLSIVPISQTKKTISYSIEQQIYNKANLSKVFTHTINQTVVYDENDKSSLLPLENKMTYYYKYGSLSNGILFNHDKEIISSSSITSKTKIDSKEINIYYTQNYIEDIDNRTIKYDLSSTFSKYYKIKYEEEYDIKNEMKKDKRIILDINKKCWWVNIGLEDDFISYNTASDTQLRQYKIYIQFELKPIVKYPQLIFNDKIRDK